MPCYLSYVYMPTFIAIIWASYRHFYLDKLPEAICYCLQTYTVIDVLLIMYCMCLPPCFVTSADEKQLWVYLCFVAQATLISKAPPRVYSPYFNKFHDFLKYIDILEEVTSFNEIRVVFNRKYYENVQNSIKFFSRVATEKWPEKLLEKLMWTSSTTGSLALWSKFGVSTNGPILSQSV